MHPNSMKATINSPGATGATIVDGHAHVWSLDVSAYPWQPTFGYIPTDAAPPEALLAAMDRLGVARTVLVQPSAYGRDHRFLFDTVRDHPDRFHPIGLVDPAESNSANLAERLVDAGCVGLRVNLALDLRQAERQAGARSWGRIGSTNVPILLRATPAHQPLVTSILAANRETAFVIDHLGLPDLSETGQTIVRLTELARFENCWLKIAGLARLSAFAFPYRDTWPVVSAALQLFGSERLVWGSDFPPADPLTGYSDAIAAMQAMPFLAAVQRNRVMRGTASELWSLSLSSGRSHA
jgi:L-fuconolactonase